MMRRSISMAMTILAVFSVGHGAFAQSSRGLPAEPIMSDTRGAMLPPEQWSCDPYFEDYRHFIKDGGSPQAWRYAGKRYRSDRTGHIYDWQMWLDWADETGCGALPPSSATSAQASGLGSGGMTAVLIVGGLLGTAAIAAGGAGGGDARSTMPNAKSPG